MLLCCLLTFNDQVVSASNRRIRPAGHILRHFRPLYAGPVNAPHQIRISPIPRDLHSAGSTTASAACTTASTTAACGVMGRYSERDERVRSTMRTGLVLMLVLQGVHDRHHAVVLFGGVRLCVDARVQRVNPLLSALYVVSKMQMLAHQRKYAV